MASPLDRSQSRAVQSELAVTRYAASTENTQSHTHLLWPAAGGGRICSVVQRGLQCRNSEIPGSMSAAVWSQMPSWLWQAVPGSCSECCAGGACSLRCVLTAEAEDDAIRLWAAACARR
jgi:hypothetical protein